MEDIRYKLYTIVSLLLIVTILSTVYAVSITFGNTALNPDAILTYYQGDLTWNLPTSDTGVADLNIFGEPPAGEDLPLIHPFSNGKYYVRLKNDVHGAINYHVYLYTENQHNIPLKFDITGKGLDIDSDAIVPDTLVGKNVVKYATGSINAFSMETLEIDWGWITKHDDADNIRDTQIGDHAVNEDLIFKFNMMVIIEDNNSYRVFDGGGSARLLHRAYVVGYPEGDFRQNGNMTRAEAGAIYARIIVNHNEKLLKSNSSSFLDVPEDKWYSHYMSKMDSTGIMQGYPDGTFRPDGFITRAEFATGSVRFTEARLGEKLDKTKIDFNDVGKDHWSYEYLRKAVNQGYVQGYPDGSFKPDDYITRAEVVTVINRMLGRQPDKQYIDMNLDRLVSYTDLKDNTYWAYYEIIEASNHHHATVRAKEDWLGTALTGQGYDLER